MPLSIVTGTPVTDDDFFDRDELLARVWSKLNTDSINLIAPRRWGKTSVMGRLRDQPSEGYRVLFFDCMGYDQPRQFVNAVAVRLLADNLGQTWRYRINSFVDHVMHLLNGESKIAYSPSATGIELNPTVRDWRSSTTEILSVLAQRDDVTVIIADEFPSMLGNWLTRGKVDPVRIQRFLEWFHHLRQEPVSRQRLRFIVGGSTNLYYWLRRLNASALMRDLESIPVPPFEPSVARDFVIQLLGTTAYEIDQSVPDRVLHHVQPAIPHWIQVLIHLAVEEARGQARLTVDDVDRVYRQALLGPAGRHYFEAYHERLAREDDVLARAARDLLSYLARAPFDDGASVSTLESTFLKGPGSERPDTFNQLVNDLELDYYLRFDAATERFYFNHKVLYDWWGRWFARRHRPDESQRSEGVTDG